jgi:hypothetical protein
VTEGLTVLVPVTPTEPIPWSIVTVVALVVFQLKVEDPPAVIVAGLTLAVAVGGGGGGPITVSVAVDVAVPVAFDTVNV